MVTILVIGDPHFQLKNVRETLLFTDRIISLALEEKPDLICVAGDILHDHERVHTIPLNNAYRLIESLRNIAKTVVLVGNHDMISCTQFLDTNHWMNGLKEWENVVVVDKIEKINIGDYVFVFAPFVPNGRFIEALDTSYFDWKKAECIFAHQEFFGCIMGAFESEVGDKWPLDYPHVVSGHIHNKQTPQQNIYYCGSSMQHSYGDTDEKTVSILDFKSGISPYKLREISLGLPRKRTVYMNVDNVSDWIPIDVEHLRVVVSGTKDEFKQLKRTPKYKELCDSGAKLIYKCTNIDTSSKIVGKGFQQILSDLVYENPTPELVVAYNHVFNGDALDCEVFFV